MRSLFGASIAVLATFACLNAAAAAEMEAPARQRPRQQRPQQQQQPQQQASNWNGGQLGGSNGASGANNNFAEPGAYICPPETTFGISCFETPFAFKNTAWSYTIGPFLGYRWQVGGAVFGVEGDFSWKNAQSSASLASTTCFDPVCGLSRTDFKQGSVKQTWDASLRARLGYLVTPWTLVYATGGVAFGDVRGSFAYGGKLFISSTFGPIAVGTATSNATFSTTRTGWTAGGGVETELFRGVKGRLEYRYADFGSFSENLPVATLCPTCAAPSSNVRIDLRESFHTIRVGIGVDL